jgi:flavorubredoxin
LLKYYFPQSACVKAAAAIQIVGHGKTAGLLADFYGITENLRIVEDGDELNLGRYTPKFLLARLISV